MNELDQLLTTAQNHGGTVIVAWLVRESHVLWPNIVKIYPYVTANGGIFQIVKRFFYNPQTQPK